MDKTSKQYSAFLRWRKLKNLLTSIAVWLGGLSVIIFIVLIFTYLFSVLIPLFFSAEANLKEQYTIGDKKIRTVWLAMEEYAEIAVRFTADGNVFFFRSKDGKPIKRVSIPFPGKSRTSSFAATDPAVNPASNDNTGWVAYGLNNGHIVIAKHHYKNSYPDDKRIITPELQFPLGKKALLIDNKRGSIIRMAIQNDEEKFTVIALIQDKRLVMAHFVKSESESDDTVKLERFVFTFPIIAHPVDYILLDKEQQNLFLISNNGELSHYNIADKETPKFVAHRRMVTAQQKITYVRFLLGDQSILLGDNKGGIHQWAMLRDKDGSKQLLYLRSFDKIKHPVTAIVSEFNRKGFVAVDNFGNFGLFHSTAHRTLLTRTIGKSAITHVALDPRGHALLAEDQSGQLHFWQIKNEHPEISWNTLWGKVLYEGYEKPDYIWQSSAASDDFEPKFSLMPITFGTLKAAFYAMLLAIPLSLMGAVYSSQFMAPQMRKQVKPTIEIMEALPTVILGFLAGLWLAPFVEQYLPGIVSIFLLMPFGILFTAVVWGRLNQRTRINIPDGWEAAILLPVLVLMIWGCIAVSPVMERWFFDGNIRSWFTNTMGVGFDQRNSIVVGLAMGFAVIPTIYSIAEDALFGVPRHLIRGSLALGATPWQTTLRVVLLTASPGIFSAIMIGLGRAVGETMIVLMATGNTPVMDFSPLQGLRTISANIAVELPESEVNSTHYRLLFLAAMILLSFTFVVNTLAELVRQRLRKKYSTL